MNFSTKCAQDARGFVGKTKKFLGFIIFVEKNTWKWYNINKSAGKGEKTVCQKRPRCNFYFSLPKGLPASSAPNCEVVVHDLDSNDPESSIVAIENGQVTGRKVGDGPSHVVLETLRGDREKLQDHLCYLTKTKDGKILKSTTIYIRNDDGTPIGIFGINYDITLMLAMENMLRQFTATEKESREPEAISRNVSDLLDELIEQSVKLVGKPVALMHKEDKVKAIQFLNETGAFLITKSGDKVCKYFGISKYTLYSYIDESKE